MGLPSIAFSNIGLGRERGLSSLVRLFFRIYLYTKMTRVICILDYVCILGIEETRGEGPRDPLSFAGRGKPTLVPTQRANQQLVGSLCARKKILRLTTANGTSATGINWEGEKEMQTARRGSGEEIESERRKRALGFTTSVYERFPCSASVSISWIRGLLSCYSRSRGRCPRRFFYTRTRFISRGFPVWEHWYEFSRSVVINTDAGFKRDLETASAKPDV